MADGNLSVQLSRCAASGIVRYNGQMPHGQVQELFARSVCSLLPSRTEALGLVIVESIAQGCPCLVSNSGDHIDFLKLHKLVGEHTLRVRADGRCVGQPSAVIVVEDVPVGSRVVSALSATRYKRCEEERVRTWAKALHWISRDHGQIAASTLAACSAKCAEDVTRLRLSLQQKSGQRELTAGSFVQNMMRVAWSREGRARRERIGLRAPGFLSAALLLPP